MFISVLKHSSIVDVYKNIEINSMEELGKLICRYNYSPIIFNDNYRHGDNFKDVEFMVIDVDDTITLEQGIELFKDYRHVIATTRNHQKNKIDAKTGRIKAGPCDRFRVVIPLSRKITKPDEYSALYQVMIQAFPGVDKSTCDLARFFYRSQDVVSVNETGKLFDVELVHSLPPKESRKEVTNYSEGAAVTLRAGGVRGELLASTKRWLREGSKEGEHYYELRLAVIDMRAQGYTYDEVYDACEQVFNNILGRELEYKFRKNIDGIFGYKNLKMQFRAPQRVEVPANYKFEGPKLLDDFNLFIRGKK